MGPATAEGREEDEEEDEEELEAWETEFPTAAGVEYGVDTDDQWAELQEEEWPVDNYTAPPDNDTAPPGAGVGDFWEDEFQALESPGQLTVAQQAFV